MKTTCLIPVPVSDWMQRNYPKGEYLITFNGGAPEFTFDLYANWDGKEFPMYTIDCVTHVYEPQSGYFFTEEEMNILLKSLIEAKDGLINQSLLSIEKGQDTAGADGMATGLMLAIKRINELLTTK